MEENPLPPMSGKLKRDLATATQSELDAIVKVSAREIKHIQGSPESTFVEIAEAFGIPTARYKECLEERLSGLITLVAKRQEELND